MPEQICPRCGRKLSSLFSLEEHQSNPSCEALQNFNQMWEKGWRPILPQMITLVADLDAPILTIMVPETALAQHRKVREYRSFWKNDHMRAQGLITITITPGWLVEVVEQVVIATKNEIRSADPHGLGPRGREFIQFLLTHDEERAAYLSALRLGGVKRACEMYEAHYDK